MEVSPRSLVRRCSDHLLVLLSVVVVFYMLGDFYSTYLTLQAGGWEQNPIPRFIIHHLGYGWFFLAKVAEALVIVGVCIYLDARTDRPTVVKGRPELRAVLSEVPVLVALLYAVLGVYLTIHNTLNFVALTTA